MRPESKDRRKEIYDYLLEQGLDLNGKHKDFDKLLKEYARAKFEGFARFEKQT